MISMDKQYQTRNGQKVRLLCVDGNDRACPVVGFIGDEIGISRWDANGTFTVLNLGCTLFDLVEVKQVKTVKLLCWRDPEGGLLTWRSNGIPCAEEWQRFPAGDIEGEVEDD